MDNFEKYIQDKRDRLDVERPDFDKVWANIKETNRRSIQPDPSRKSKFNYWKVAAVLFFAISAYYVFQDYTSNADHPTYSLGDIAPQYQEIEANFTKEIDEIWVEIGQYDTAQQEIAWLFDELKVIEEVNQDFLKDIPGWSDNEKLVGALLDYYEKKIRTLNKILREIQRQKRHENENNAQHI